MNNTLNAVVVQLHYLQAPGSKVRQLSHVNTTSKTTPLVLHLLELSLIIVVVFLSVVTDNDDAVLPDIALVSCLR